ncbi:vegetative cell wall protein gp1-like [Octopus sinensis]|uniref:Vegetative cell wall protein gp1-like n=1 Tax=Octopus sinensis TaxID=2607531 RepID=A0A6P7U4I1_9MOLL|nr:vegetative cell wall protein gp1-like [Octopus sinensis]
MVRQCVNCGKLGHTANFKGCRKFKEATRQVGGDVIPKVSRPPSVAAPAQPTGKQVNQAKPPKSAWVARPVKPASHRTPSVAAQAQKPGKQAKQAKPPKSACVAKPVMPASHRTPSIAAPAPQPSKQAKQAKPPKSAWVAKPASHIASGSVPPSPTKPAKRVKASESARMPKPAMPSESATGDTAQQNLGAKRLPPYVEMPLHSPPCEREPQDSVSPAVELCIRLITLCEEMKCSVADMLRRNYAEAKKFLGEEPI